MSLNGAISLQWTEPVSQRGTFPFVRPTVLQCATIMMIVSVSHGSFDYKKIIARPRPHTPTRTHEVKGSVTSPQLNLAYCVTV